jgi:hypothetical protein
MLCGNCRSLIGEVGTDINQVIGLGLFGIR